MSFDKLNINYELIVSKIYKNGLKTHPPLDYAIIKFTSSALGINLSVWNVFLHNDVTVYIQIRKAIHRKPIAHEGR